MCDEKNTKPAAVEPSEAATAEQSEAVKAEQSDTATAEQSDTATAEQSEAQKAEQSDTAKAGSAMDGAVSLALALIGAAMEPARPCPSATEAEVTAAYLAAKRHDLGHLVAHAVLAGGILPEGSPLLPKLEHVRFTAVYRAERIAHEARRAAAILEEAAIPHILLKGAVLRGLYPEEWMRTSSDVDILVPRSRHAEAARAFASKGYAEGERGSHDVVFKSPAGIPVELHYSLMEEGLSGKMEAPLSRIWEHAAPVAVGKWEHRLSDGAFYYYHVAHMAKHVLCGGCGIRPFLDLWIMRGRIPPSEALLDEGGLLPLARAAEALVDAWFLGGEMTPALHRLARFVFTGGVYGTVENRVLASKERKGGKLGYILSRLFLPYAQLAEAFPVIRRHKWLTPFYQMVRWWRMVRDGRMHRTRHELAAVKGADPAAADDARLLMEELSL